MSWRRFDALLLGLSIESVFFLHRKHKPRRLTGEAAERYAASIGGSK